MISKKHCVLWLFKFLFYVFFMATVVTVFFYIFIPTPEEWPGSFPTDSPAIWKWSFWQPFIRHLSLFIENMSGPRLIGIVNLAFLTIFIYKIGIDIDEGIKEHGKPRISVYVDWAIGSLVSGIIFASARIDPGNPQSAAIYLALVFMFSFVAYFILYRLRQKLIDAESISGKPASATET